MEIRLTNLGKRFRKEWIFRNLNLTLSDGLSYAITGPNGSGKSTLLKVISGFIPATTGEISYLRDGIKVDPDAFYKNISFVAPYLELIEEFTLSELLRFHFSFKNIQGNYTTDEIIDIMGLKHSADKPVHDFSSGMKQRVKLALAFYSQTAVVFLDEPTINLDAQGFQWYLDHVEKRLAGRLCLVASNQKNEYEWAANTINLQDCKI